MPVANNDAELQAMLLNDFQSIIANTLDELYDMLIVDINREVYDANIPKAYIRQGSFGGLRGSFAKEIISNSTNNRTIDGRIFQDINRLNHNPDLFIHGSDYWQTTDDIRDILSDIITLGTSGPFFGTGFWTDPRDFWGHVEWYVNSGRVKDIINRELNTRGISFRRI